MTIFHKPNIRGILCAVCAALLGVAVTFSCQAWWDSSPPTTVKVKEVQLHSIPGTTERWLDVYLLGPPAQHCGRLTQHLLYRDIPSVNGSSIPTKDFVPLGSAMNGPSFSSTEQEFIVTVRLPDGLQNGKWWYINRSLFVCRIWPGLIRMYPLESKPVEVSVKDSAVQDIK